MVAFPILYELVEQPKDLWFGYYPYLMDIVHNEREPHRVENLSEEGDGG